MTPLLRGYGSLETSAALQLQGFARRLLAQRMLRSHRRGTPDHQRVIAEIQRATPQLQQQADKLAAEMLRWDPRQDVDGCCRQHVSYPGHAGGKAALATCPPNTVIPLPFIAGS